MPDNSERKRLKKKMLDRWENEGGSIAAEPVIPSQAKKPASQRKIDSTSTSKKKRAPTRK